MNMNKKDENYIYYIIGQNLKKHRKNKGYSVTKLSQLSNYSEGFIMNLESPNYIQTVSLGTLWKFALVLEIDVRELLKPLND